MGQKVNPNSFRLQIRKDWQSVWYTGGNFYGQFIEVDFLIRRAITTHYKSVPISKIIIERNDCADNTDERVATIQISIYCGNTGSLIGRQGKEIDILKKKLNLLLPNKDFKINIVDIKRIDIDAVLIAKNIAVQIEKRGNYKKVVKKFLESAMKFDDCLGIKIMASGRLGGAEIAKSEIFKQGSIPLHRLKANIYYGFAEAKTTYGIVGIKTWVYLSSYI